MIGVSKLYIFCYLLIGIGELLLHQTVSAQEIQKSPNTNYLSGDSNLEMEYIGPVSGVNNVYELRDVSPGDWAFEALQNLAERYNCLQGYANDLFLGDRPLSRFEFATGVDLCIRQIEKLIAANVKPIEISPEEQDILDRLQREFIPELAFLRGRVDGLEARIGDLEAMNFSPTTKLKGSVFINLTGAFAGGEILAEGENARNLFNPARDDNNRPRTRLETDNPQITLSNLVFLDLDTSFTGRDLLKIQLAAGNGDSPINQFVSTGLLNTYGNPYTEQNPSFTKNNVVIRELFYSFHAGNHVQFIVGPTINWESYFDQNQFTALPTGASSFNAKNSTLTNIIPRGSGAIFSWKINRAINFKLGYLAENTGFFPSQSAANPEAGLFNGTNNLTTELTYSPGDRVNFRFLYGYANLAADNGLVGGTTRGTILGVADDGFGGSLKDANAHAFGFNFDWLITNDVGIFGRYSFSDTNLEPDDSNLPKGSLQAQSVQLGVAFPDLFKEGALATLSYLIPFSVLDGRNFLVSGGGDGGVQYEFEATYYYPLNDHLALVPAFYWIGNPNNFSNNPNIYVGNLRFQLQF